MMQCCQFNYNICSLKFLLFTVLNIVLLYYILASVNIVCRLLHIGDIVMIQVDGK